MSARGPSSLVGDEELVRALAEVTVLDVRYRTGGPAGREEYGAGHVPGASYVDLDADLADPPGPRGRHPLPAPDAFEQAMRAAGVRGDRPVVVYDDWSGHAAARCWWLLRYFGHPDVRVLDGGWSAWSAAGHPVETGPGSTPEPGDLTVVPGGMPVLDADAVLSTAVVVDARAPERYRGEVEPIDPVAGHIPGAVNVPTSRNLDEGGRLRSPEELRELYASVGARPDVDVAAYCGSGVTAALDVLAMDVAGIPAALYPGSWSEWVADPDRPVETITITSGPP
ncbi:MAG TPA: sulfurtransferase [Nocardioides sp.]|nr:sulfurtransferase [Nocardioides sp.]